MEQYLSITHSPLQSDNSSSFVLLYMVNMKMGQVATLEDRMQEGKSGVGEEKQTPYGLEELDFLAHLQDADPEL